MVQDWRDKLKPYAKADLLKAWLQILNTVVPYLLLFTLMVVGVYYKMPYILMLLLAVPTGAFMVRVFILFHDCTHLSFFKTKRANQITGHLLSILTFTPYTIWQTEHNRHHGSVGNLDKRGIGDVWTMTVEEYLSSTKGKRLQYRIYRNPVFLFFIAPFILFALINRFPNKTVRTFKDHMSLWITNGGILATAVLISVTFGFKVYVLVQIPVLFFASVMGVWLFFVQHQFDEVYWKRNQEWNFVKAAIEGSSFYKLPLVLDWITGHIGYHHIHHLNPRIPNYHLRACYRDLNDFKAAKTIRFFESFKMALLTLYDEKTGHLIRIRELKRRAVI